MILPSIFSIAFSKEIVRAVVLSKTGGPNILGVSEVDDPKPQSNEVLVRTKYSGVNYADLLCRQGLYSWAGKRPFIMGLEAAGVIEEIGDQVDNANVGDRVIVAKNHGGYAEMITCEVDLLLPVPTQFSFQEAAAFVGNWFTAWVALHEMARVRPKESLLVHAAAGGVGTAAVKLGLAHEMYVYGTSSSKEKLEFIRESGATPLSYEDFDQQLRELGGVDCVLESIGGDVYRRSFAALSPLGRIVLVGGSGIQVNKWNPISWWKAWRSLPRAKMSQVLRQSKGFMGLHLGYLREYHEKMRPIYENLVKLVTEQDFRPTIREDQIFAMSDVAKAHQLIHDRKNIGKVLLDPTR
ncbi:MAG: alcohol dehydrogenase catalytic domain-containing protein [Candidatus Kariarchaeaceae archaeon]